MADARSPIRATRHLVFPGHRLIHTPAHQRTLTPCGTLGISTRHSLRACPLKPEPSQRSRRKPSASSAVQTAGVVVMRREEGAGFPTNSFSFSSSRTRRRTAVISASISRGSGRPSRTAWRRTHSSVTHRPTTDSPSPQSRATDAIADPVSNTRHATSRRYSGVKRRRVPITGTPRSADTHPLHEESTTPAKAQPEVLEDSGGTSPLIIKDLDLNPRPTPTHPHSTQKSQFSGSS